MNWSRSQSILLSKICIGLFLLAMAVGAITLPSVIGGIIYRRGMDPTIGRMYFFTSFYSLLFPAVMALICLYLLLNNISREEIFVRNNVRYLRWISWACYLAALISLMSACYYLPYMVLAAGVGFVGLVLRVVKNVFDEAVHLKEENDFTI